jgi:peptide/nickel transport system substrate-binding protein
MRKLTFFLVVLLVLAAMPFAGAAQAQTQNTFVIGLAENSTSLDPARGYEQQTSIVHAATYETLITFPPDNVEKIIPALASSWAISDDGLTYTFTLAEGRTFASGNVMTSADVVFSYNRLMNVKGNPSSLTATIESVTAPDAKTVVVKLKQADPAILARMIFSGFAVTDSATIKAQGGTDAADAAEADKAEAWLNNNSAGTGPYMLTKWEKDTEMVLVKNPNYNGATPAAFDQIILRNLPEASAQKAALEAGDIDLAFDLSADQLASLKANADITVYEGIGPYVFFLIMNNDPAIGGPMSNPLVQKAIRQALDYEGIRKLVGGAAATPGSLIPLGFAGAYTTEQAMKRDVEAAKKTLAESGMPPITIDLNYWDATFSGVNLGIIAQKVQADLKEIGITVNLAGGDISVKLANYRDGKDALGLWFWGPDFIDALNYAEFLPDMKVGKRANWTNANSDAEIQGLRDAVLNETDAAKRAELFGSIQAYWQEKGPFAPLLQSGVQIGYRADLKGFAYNVQWAINPATFSR